MEGDPYRRVRAEIHVEGGRVKFICRFCGEVFDEEDISVPMDDPGWINVRDTCPRCHRGMDNWYIS